VILPVMKNHFPLRFSVLILMIAIGAGTVACSGARGTLSGERVDAEEIDRVGSHYDRPAYLLFNGEGEPAGYNRIHEAAMHHDGAYLAHSQASKDATMAHFIMKQHEKARPRPVRILHANGTYHSDSYEGIYWYLRHYRFQGSIMTVSTSRQADLLPAGQSLPDDHELLGRADFLLVVPERMTRTH